MKVLLLFTFKRSIDQWYKSGIIQRELSLYYKLLEKDVDITFLTFGDNKDLNYSNEFNGIKIIPTLRFIKSKIRRVSFLKSFLLPLKLKKLFKNVDVIKTNQLEGSWVAWLAKILFRKRLIVRGGFEWLKFYILQNSMYKNRNYITYWLKFFWKYVIELISYKLADRIVLSNPDDIEFIIKMFRLKKNKRKIRLFYNFIEVERFKQINIEKKDKHILFIGRFNQQKNLVNLIKAFKNLEGFTLDLIGDGPDKKVLIREAKNLGVNVNFLGTFPNNEIPRILNQYPIFILPSYYEGNPKVLLEAMSCQIPCIGADVYGIKNIIKHKETGYLCGTDSESIKNAIIALYENETLRNEIGYKAREFILNNCSLDLIANKEFLLYKSLFL